MSSLKNRMEDLLGSIKKRRFNIATEIKKAKINEPLGYFEDIDRNLESAEKLIRRASFYFGESNFDGVKLLIYDAELHLEVTESFLGDIKKSR